MYDYSPDGNVMAFHQYINGNIGQGQPRFAFAQATASLNQNPSMALSEPGAQLGDDPERATPEPSIEDLRKRALPKQRPRDFSAGPIHRPTNRTPMVDLWPLTSN